MDYIPLVEKYKDGDVIITEGIVSNSAFVVLSGRVRIVKTIQGQQVVVGKLEKGNVFGEMGLISEAPRSATVVADGEATLGSIDKKKFRQRLNEIPEDLRFVVTALVDRLAATTERLANVGVQLEETRRVVGSYSFQKDSSAPIGPI